MATKFDSNRVVNWYRTPVEPRLLQELNQRSDAKGLAQASGHLGLIVLSGMLAVYAQQQLAWLLLPALLLHGTVCAFMSNAEHELVHGTVFNSAWLNRLFLNLFGFLRWFPYDYYWASHTEHHKYTLHPPQDLEVVLPTRFTLLDFLGSGFIDLARLKEMLLTNLRLGSGRLQGEWETYVLAQDPQRHAVFRWSRILLAGHLAIAVVSIYAGYWIVPVVVSLTPCYGGWLFYLCNNTQHAGLQDNVADFRLNCRTLTLNPVIEFLYWHMNFHTEHHMYAAVPCYNLRKLHEAIRQDLPATVNGLVRTWRQIIAIQRRQLQQPAEHGDTPQGTCQPDVQHAGTSNEAPVGIESVANRIWECSICGFAYAERLGLPEAGIAPGCAWEDIPDDWLCPDCGTSKAEFHMVVIAGAV